MSRNTVRCLELAFLVTVLNLVLSFAVVQWYSSSSSSSLLSSSSSDSRVSPQSSQDSRLLLSVEYPDPSNPSQTSQTSPVSSSGSSSASVSSSPAPASSGLSPELRLDLSQGVFDQARLFRSHMFSLTGSQWAELSTSRLVCLGAQTSVDRLYELTELITNWSGPMSISVFVPDIELGIGLKYIQYLRSCYPAIEKQVSFHLTYPADHPGLQDVSFDELVGKLDCKQPKQVMKYLLEKRDEEMMGWRPSYPYPQNLLRNLAKKGCQTNYTYIPDIDMVPTPGMDLKLETFLLKDQERNNCTHCAFVIPTYEISLNASHLPQSKAELLDFLKEKQARQFHQALYSINQKSSNLLRWEKLAETPELEVAYKVEKYIFKYEPLYVSRGDTPPFDERFIGFGMTRNTQVIGWYLVDSHVLSRACFCSSRSMRCTWLVTVSTSSIISSPPIGASRISAVDRLGGPDRWRPTTQSLMSSLKR